MLSLKLKQEKTTIKMEMKAFEQLSQGQSVVSDFLFAGNKLQLVCQPIVQGAFTTEWQLGPVTKLTVFIPEVDLQVLQEKGRNKHGLTYDQDGGKICLQIDVRDFKRQK